MIAPPSFPVLLPSPSSSFLLLLAPLLPPCSSLLLLAPPSSSFLQAGLRKLDASHNRLETLPEELASLSTLQLLLLRGNTLQTLPNMIGDCGELKYLDVAENRLLELPTSIGNIGTSLVSLIAYVTTVLEHIVAEENRERRAWWGRALPCGIDWALALSCIVLHRVAQGYICLTLSYPGFHRCFVILPGTGMSCRMYQ